MTDFRGARGSNTGDDFHELWAARQAIRLLLNEDGLEAITVEGLGSRDEAGAPRDAWDGVDCAQYFGGRDASEANHVQIEQLKYSAANPRTPWTIARLAYGKRGKSVVAHLAKAWKRLSSLAPEGTSVSAVLVSNQPLDPEVLAAVRRAATSALKVPNRKPPATAEPEVRLAYAAALNAEEFRAFAAELHFDAGAGSRFAIEERVLGEVAEWTDLAVQRVVTDLREFVRERMLPESARETITRESVLLHFGASDPTALFPCPSAIASTEAPISRATVREAVGLLRSGVRRLCLHGRAGVGKTTALQEIEEALPAGSIPVKFDCYGGGRYLDSDALRHRSQDAFVQLTNDLAARLRLPLLLSRHVASDYPRLFSDRLKHAAHALAVQHPEALIVIAVDAADNAITAAQSREPPETPFVYDFVRLGEPPENVRFIVAARTGRLEGLRLPSAYCTREIEPFTREETGENVSRVWAAPDPWVDDFHHFSAGVPRVQGYAFKIDGAHPSTALDRLRPAGKSLGDIFQQQFDHALVKSGTPVEIAGFCAALIALPRPVPLPDLSAILEIDELQIADICADLAPGIRMQVGGVGFADEDFEDFVRAQGEEELARVQDRAAERFLSRASHDPYAALHVATALVAAGRGSDLLNLVEEEPIPVQVTDPVLRREAELQRLRLAIKVCRKAGNVSRALRFVLMGAESVKTETALRRLLVANPDLAARFALEAATRLILSDTDRVEDHGPVLFHKLSVDADRGDAISYREGLRFLDAWMQARAHHRKRKDTPHHEAWPIRISEIASTVEAASKLDGPAAALRALRRWTPKRVALDVALTLPYRLIAAGHGDDIEALAAGKHLGPLGCLFLLVPLALAGRAIDVQRMTHGLEELARRKLRVKRFFGAYHSVGGDVSTHARVLDAVLTACEILTFERAASGVVDKVLAEFLVPELRRIDRHGAHHPFKLHILFRAYALREARAGRIPEVRSVFVPLPTPRAQDERGDGRHRHELVESHDRPLMELAAAVFEIYAAVSVALVIRRGDDESAEHLRRAIGTLRRESWRFSREHGGSELRRCAATHLLVLLAAGSAPRMLMRLATEVHGRWRSGSAVPDDQLLARLILWPSLHASLLEDLCFAADETRAMRIGANERSGALVSYARLMKPLSEPDARATFNTAIDVAGELDQEVKAQIRFLAELVKRGGNCFANARETTRRLGNIVADAAIRLGEDYFPWEQAMTALARLDAPLALANAARWDDEAVVRLDDTLPPVLQTGLREGTIRSEQVAALAMLTEDGGTLTAAILRASAHSQHPRFPALVEEGAYDVLIRDAHRARRQVLQCIEQTGPIGPWSSSLFLREQFIATLKRESTASEAGPSGGDTRADEIMAEHVWSRNALVDGSLLQDTVHEVWNRMQAERCFVGRRVIYEFARKSVSPAERTAHLSALAEQDHPAATAEAVEAILLAVDEWWTSPSVREWCGTELPEVIVTRLPAMIGYLAFGEDSLSPALTRTGLADPEIRELLLRGLERHVDGMTSEAIFSLAGRIGSILAPSEAAGLVDWYAERLEERIPAGERDQTEPDIAMPRAIDEAVARFLFAYMGDCDLRLRWRAAHAVRRLARIGDETTLTALVAEYSRRDERVFRGHEFYWLAARLWFVLAWDRVAGEKPEFAERVGPDLLRIALDESFPHLLVRSFARDACAKLVAAGRLALTPEISARLAQVSESPLPRAPAVPNVRDTIGHGHGADIARKREGLRFKFDSVDTLPYWYAPMLESFSAVDAERFVQEAERWIVDEWGYSGEIRSWDKEPRRFRLDRGNWSLVTHSHGSTPTLERLHTHLEWHAMWCAAGGLLKTEPLAPLSEDNWHDLSAQVERQKLAEPPLWSADLLAAMPLLARNWHSDTGPLDDWALGVRETDHRAEIFPDDSPSHVIVAGSSERRMADRIERTSVSSALVEPATGHALLRALQTMPDSWDYKLPDEGEERVEIDEAPYRLLGWLRRSDSDYGIDRKDPFRGYASHILSRPGRRVTAACGLARNSSGRPSWSSGGAKEPMFAYEAWGVAAGDDEPYRTDFAVAGQRLLAHKEQLLRFVREQRMNLIVEAEMTRRERRNRSIAGEEGEATREGRFARLYLLDTGGNLHVAEGCLGTWTGDSPSA